MKEKKEMIKEMKLEDALRLMHWYNQHHYNCFFEGHGDGTVSVIAEDEVITIT